jgi:hypothetical protein
MIWYWLPGRLLDCSKENSSPHSRHAYSIHFVEGAPGYRWVPDNWLQRTPDLPFEPLYDRTADQAGAGGVAGGASGVPAGHAHTPNRPLVAAGGV